MATKNPPPKRGGLLAWRRSRAVGTAPSTLARGDDVAFDPPRIGGELPVFRLEQKGVQPANVINRPQGVGCDAEAERARQPLTR